MTEPLEIMDYRKTGRTLPQLRDLERRGLIQLLPINKRVICIAVKDWNDLPAKLAAERRRQAIGAGQLAQATVDALLKEYGTVPGARAQ